MARLDRISFESGYIVAMQAVWNGLYPSNEPALRTFMERAWKATGADREQSERKSPRGPDSIDR